MNGWETIKEVRLELSEARGQACDGHKSTASACMKHATSLLLKYCTDERGPDHGFEGRNSKCKRDGG